MDMTRVAIQQRHFQMTNLHPTIARAHPCCRKAEHGLCVAGSRSNPRVRLPSPCWSRSPAIGAAKSARWLWPGEIWIFGARGCCSSYCFNQRPLRSANFPSNRLYRAAKPAMQRLDSKGFDFCAQTYYISRVRLLLPTLWDIPTGPRCANHRGPSFFGAAPHVASGPDP
jgi:hypothetical protein